MTWPWTTHRVVQNHNKPGPDFWSTSHPTVIIPLSGSLPDTPAGLNASHLTTEDRGEQYGLTHPTTAKRVWQNKPSRGGGHPPPLHPLQLLHSYCSRRWPTALGSKVKIPDWRQDLVSILPLSLICYVMLGESLNFSDLRFPFRYYLYPSNII